MRGCGGAASGRERGATSASVRAIETHVILSSMECQISAFEFCNNPCLVGRGVGMAGRGVDRREIWGDRGKAQDEG